ncbi:hypothetical protein N0V88_001225 [Collariella sp. IMI 366227]|nr:hypothetical protein N0V88_001225 [Collariella sp. IMI 366227]
MAQRAAKFPSRPEAQLLGSNGPVHALAYSASPGTYILTGSSDRSIRLYNPSNTAPSHTTTTSNTITASTQTTPPPLPAARLIQTYTSHSYAVLSSALLRQRPLRFCRRRPRGPPLGRRHGTNDPPLRRILHRTLPHGAG